MSVIFSTIRELSSINFTWRFVFPTANAGCNIPALTNLCIIISFSYPVLLTLDRENSILWLVQIQLLFLTQRIFLYLARHNAVKAILSTGGLLSLAISSSSFCVMPMYSILIGGLLRVLSTCLSTLFSQSEGL